MNRGWATARAVTAERFVSLAIFEIFSEIFDEVARELSEARFEAAMMSEEEAKFCS